MGIYVTKECLPDKQPLDVWFGFVGSNPHLLASFAGRDDGNLANKGHSAEDVEKMYAAWVKSCLLQVTRWSYPYVNDGDV